MANDSQTLKATCLCGSSAHDLDIRKEDLPLKAYMCHCDSCRHMTGQLCLTVTFLPEYYQPAQSLIDKLKGFIFSKRITQYFCTTCGCFMLARCQADGDDPASKVTWDVTSGTLDKIDGILDWQSHENIQDTLDGGFSDMLHEVDGKRLQRWPAHFGGQGKASVNLNSKSDTTEELPLHWQSSSRPKVQVTSTDRLHGYCICGGVDFYIARPSQRSAVAKKAWPKLPSSEEAGTYGMPPESESYWIVDHGTKFRAGLCACDSCRLASGTETQFWTFIPTVDLSLDRDGKVPFTFGFGTLKKYTSSPGCHRFFCGTCGATCFYDADDRQWMKDVSVGLLAAEEGARAESWLGWRTNSLGFRVDTDLRSNDFSDGTEAGLKAWEEQREGDDLSGPILTGGAL